MWKKNGEKKCSMWKLSFHLFVYTALFLVSIWTASFYYVFISGMCNLNRIVSLVVEHIETNVSSPITLMLFLFTTILYSVCFVLYTSKALEAKSSKIHASTRCVLKHFSNWQFYVYGFVWNLLSFPNSCILWPNTITKIQFFSIFSAMFSLFCVYFHL